LVPGKKFSGIDVRPELFVFAEGYLYMSVIVFPHPYDIQILRADLLDPHDDPVSQT
jgi:hypothetical protein